jgi:hypothetical protein
MTALSWEHWVSRYEQRGLHVVARSWPGMEGPIDALRADTSEIDGDRAWGESDTIAHHLFTVDGERMIMIASLRYRDTFAKIDGSWLFAERILILDWSETRRSASLSVTP